MAAMRVNQRFNDKRPGICYSISIDGEREVPTEEVRQRTDFVNKGFLPDTGAYSSAVSG